MTVTLPPGEWIPDVDQLANSAAGLLAVAGEALDSYNLGGPFRRRVFTHGDQVPLLRGDKTPPSQLIVTIGALELGDAGQKQYQYQKGDLGSAVHMVGAFGVEVWVPWPLPEGGIAPTLAKDADLMEAIQLLGRCGWIVFAALRSLSFGSRGGVRTDPPVTPIVQDNIHVGPMTPAGPTGGLAGYKIAVQLQYD